MKFGVFLPIPGRAAGPETLTGAARQAEALGYDSVWWRRPDRHPMGNQDALSVQRRTKLHRTAGPAVLRAAHVPRVLAGCTKRSASASACSSSPYRQTALMGEDRNDDRSLVEGRLILGVGVGWMAEEFEALGANFAERGELSDEQLDLLKVLWEQERAKFSGRYYRFENIAFSPKPLQKPRIPIWVGGEGKRAQRRAGEYGDAWAPAAWA